VPRPRQASRAAVGATEAEIEAVYRARFNDFCSVANSIIGERERARDAVQEAFAGALRRRHQWRRRGSLDAWLWRAVVNAAHDEQRRQDGRRRAAARAARDDRWARNQHQSSRALAGTGDVAGAMSALAERQRLVLFLRYFGDLDCPQIADVLGLKTGTVAATIHQALERLKVELEVTGRD
jgi:RNA polymerase sigma factor (sigma-70 family)